MAIRMTRWKKTLLALAGGCAVLAGAAYAWRGDIALAVMKRNIVAALSIDPIADLPDGLHVGLCGAGSPLPDALRSGPCVAVVAGRRLFVVDAGDGAARNLQRMALAPGRVEAVLLTHFHSDHIDGLGALMLQRWIAGASATPLPIHGPQGVDAVVAGFNAAYAQDRGYRIAHHGPQVAPPGGFGGLAKSFTATASTPFTRAAEIPDVVVISDGDLKVTAFPVSHAPVEPAVGYSFEYKGRKVVISGDTTPSPRVEAAAKGADLLVHEALAPKLVGLLEEGARAAGRSNLEKIFKDIIDYHTTPEQAADIAQRAGVGYLLLHHIVPALPLDALEQPFLGASRTRFSGPIKLGRDGDFISMPAGTKAINATKRLN
jgi:ribonuclease Z